MSGPEPRPVASAESERGWPPLEVYLGTYPIAWPALERFLAVPPNEFWTRDVLAPLGWDVAGPRGEGSPPASWP